jgi:hypothetical protein
MNFYKIQKFLSLKTLYNEIKKSSISTSSRVEAGKGWRYHNNMHKLQTARGPLTDYADYSFLGTLKVAFKTLIFVKNV